MYETPEIWAGSQESLELVLKAAQVTFSAYGSRREDDFPPLWEAQDGVAVISISGPTISGSAGFMRMFGVVGYTDIQEAFAEAAADSSVRSILAVYASGGGAVPGCDECSEFIASVSKVKPVVSYAAGNMQSAAYWLGSAGARVYASRTSFVGSIGVFTVAIDRSKQLENDGIKVKVVRSGKWKGLGTGLEPFTDEYLESVQAKVDQLNAVFEERVAANLGVPRSQVSSRMGQGREFLAAEAVEVGLIKAVATSQEAFEVARILGR